MWRLGLWVFTLSMAEKPEQCEEPEGTGALAEDHADSTRS